MKNAAALNTKRKYLPPVYTKGEEIFNAVSHIVGGAFGLIALIVLLIYTYPNPSYMWAVTAFGLGIIILYTMSALYHFLPSGGGKKVFRIFDHCTIFLLIAGTYTPFCVIALEGNVLGLIILIIEWSLAVIGITGNAIAMNNKFVKALSMASYCVMGWLILIAFVPLMQSISAASFWLLLLGGIAYTFGILFYALGKKVKYFHSVWHLFDILGTVLQFASILLILL